MEVPRWVEYVLEAFGTRCRSDQESKEHPWLLSREKDLTGLRKSLGWDGPNSVFTWTRSLTLHLLEPLFS